MEFNKEPTIIGLKVLADNVIWLWKKNKSIVVIDPALSEPVIEYIKGLIRNDQSESYKNSINLLDSISKLIDEDLILTIADRVFAPLYRQTKEKDFTSKILDLGFRNCQRISTTPKYKNIRKIVEPLYTDYNNDLAKIFYGDGGVMNFIVMK